MPWARSRSSWIVSFTASPSVVEHLGGASRGRRRGCPWPAAGSRRGRRGAAARRRGGCARSCGARRRRWRRCGHGRRAAPRWRAAGSSRLSCSAESSCTLCRARPTWRASSVSTRSSSSVKWSPSAGRSTTMQAEQLARVATRARRAAATSSGPRAAPGSHTSSHALPDDAGPGDDRAAPRGRARAASAPRSGTDTASSRRPGRAGPDLGRAGAPASCAATRPAGAAARPSGSTG